LAFVVAVLAGSVLDGALAATGLAGKMIRGWRISGIGSFHSNVPFTPVLGFDNADVQSIVNSQRPDLIGNPYMGSCPNGSPMGTVTCWFNPSAFALSCKRG
jgi:hypothetical protein